MDLDIWRRLRSVPWLPRTREPEPELCDGIGSLSWDW